MMERMIAAVFVLGFLTFYDPSLTAYKVIEEQNNPRGEEMEAFGPGCVIVPIWLCALET